MDFTQLPPGTQQPVRGLFVELCQACGRYATNTGAQSAPYRTQHPMRKLVLSHLLYNLWLIYLVLALKGFYGIEHGWRYWAFMLPLVFLAAISRKLGADYEKARAPLERFRQRNSSSSKGRANSSLPNFF